MKLYDLKENYKKICEYLYEEEIADEDLLSALGAIEEDIEDKADNYAKLIQNLNSDIVAIELEEKRLTDRKNALVKRTNILKENLKSTLEEINKPKFKTSLFSFSICRNGGKQPIKYEDNIDLAEIEERFIKPELNKDEVRVALEDGEYLEFAKLLPRGTHLRIK